MEESIIYIVMEIQSDGSTANCLVTAYEDKNAAENKYHTVLAAAAVSAVPKHSAVMLTDDGTRLKGETYYHGSQPVPGK